MARKKRSKHDQWLMPALRYLIIAVVTIAALFFLTQVTVSSAKKAEMFKIKEVVRAPTLQYIESRYLRRLMGQNIFEVNLAYVRNRLQAQYPEIDDLKVVRRFPDKILVAARKREPVAFLAQGNALFLIDRDGVVLGSQASSPSGLPIISGVAVYRNIVLGKPIRDRNLGVALGIIRDISVNAGLRGMKVTSVQVGNLSKIEALLENGLRVILDTDRTSEKIRQLGLVLGQSTLDLKNYEYVDLRFKEPILGQK